MKKQLEKVLNQLDKEDSNKQTLGYEALAIIKGILVEKPFDIDMLTLRMRLNANIFENSSEIIQDATFIIENDQFKKEKMIGYDWLFWVYKDVLGMPEKAIETIEEQLIEVHSVFDKKHEKDKKEGELLDKFAEYKHQNNQQEEALDLWYKSYKKYPYFDRNAFVGILFLEQGEYTKAEELLLTHYDWSYHYEDGFRLKYGIKLKELYDKKELDNYPTLLGLLFNIIRNEEDYFKVAGKLDFLEKYYPEVEKWIEKYPKNAFLWTAIAHTHHFDTKNYEKAFNAYAKLFECEKTIAFTNIHRIHKAAKKSKKNFFSLAYKFKGISNNMYSALTDMSDLTDKAKKKKKKKKYAELAVQYGEVGYNQYRKYLYEGKGNTHSNQPHIFAMLCNNYANALGRYADLFLKKEEKAKMYDLAGKIHMEGYEISPFLENLENASIDYYKGKNYKESIACSIQSMTDYKNDLSIYDFQYHYWQVVRSNIKIEDILGAEKYYLKAKELFKKVGKGSKDANYKFIFTAKLFLEYAITKKNEYQKYITELEWFLEQGVAIKQEPKEHGLISYYLGLCYKKTKQKQKAIEAFQVTVDYLQDAEWGFYDTKCEMAEDYIKELDGKVIKKEKPKQKKKSMFKRMRDAILFPFMFFALIGGIIYAAAIGKSKVEKKNKG